MRHDLVNTKMPSNHGRIVGILSQSGGNRMMLFINSLSARGLAPPCRNAYGPYKEPPNRVRSGVRGLEELGVRKAGSGFLESHKGQAGGGGLGVDQPVEETGFGRGKSLGRKQREQLGMHDKGRHGEELSEAGEHRVLGHTVVVLAGEVGFQHDEIRNENLGAGLLGLRHVAACDRGQIQRLAGE